jgi:hypothetical protein
MAITKEDILEAVGAMTVMELNTLVKAFEEKFGVSAASMAVAAPGAAAAVVEEQTEFTVVLAGIGEKKVEVIKVVPRGYRPWPERSKGSRRQRTEGGQGVHFQGRRRSPQEAPRGCRREGRGQVVLVKHAGLTAFRLSARLCFFGKRLGVCPLG